MANKKADSWLQKNWDAVAKQYPDQWVAADENGVVANGKKSCCVMKSVQAKGISSKNITIAFMPGEKAVYQ